jgi:hypothetical protein
VVVQSVAVASSAAVKPKEVVCAVADAKNSAFAVAKN